jgi:hypothetical protein
MPCLLVIILLGFPRLALLLIVLFTDWMAAAFETRVWPVVGFLFLPYTTLCYMWASIQTHHQINGGWAFLVALGVILDLGTHGSSGRRRRKRK